jgi:hypothetical protein
MIRARPQRGQTSKPRVAQRTLGEEFPDHNSTPAGLDDGSEVPCLSYVLSNPDGVHGPQVAFPGVRCATPGFTVKPRLGLASCPSGFLRNQLLHL